MSIPQQIGLFEGYGGLSMAVEDVLAQVGSSFPWGEYTDAIRTWERQLGRPAPGPAGSDGEESPAFAEWMMGLPAGHVTGVPELTVPDQLRLLGNGVLLAQAAAALRHLLNIGSSAVAA